MSQCGRDRKFKIMSLLIGYLYAGEGEEPDPATGLSAAQGKAIADTWLLVRKDLKLHGTKILIELFKAHPQYQAKFKGFANVPLEDMPKNKKVHAHACNIMFTLDNMVCNLTDIDVLTEVTMKVGRSHKPRDLSTSDFQNFSKVVLDYLSSALEGHMTAVAKDAWAKVLNVVIKIMDEGMKA